MCIKVVIFLFNIYTFARFLECAVEVFIMRDVLTLV